jgi:hypothetical protein
MNEEQLRQVIFHAITECKDARGESIVGRTDHAKQLRDAIFDAIRELLNLDGLNNPVPQSAISVVSS